MFKDDAQDHLEEADFLWIIRRLGVQEATHRLFLSGPYEDMGRAILRGGHRIVPEGEPIPLLRGKTTIQGDKADVILLPPGIDHGKLTKGESFFTVPMSKGYRLVFIKRSPTAQSIENLARYGYVYDRKVKDFVKVEGGVS